MTNPGRSSFMTEYFIPFQSRFNIVYYFICSGSIKGDCGKKKKGGFK